MTQDTQSARFWTYESLQFSLKDDGDESEHGEAERWLLISLAPGETFTHGEGGPTEEGYHAWHTTYRHAGEFIEYEYASESRDCDGPLDRYYSARTPVDQLPAVGLSDVADEVKTPDWEKLGSSQRDHFAERMGY